MISKERNPKEHVEGDLLSAAGAKAELKMAFYLRRGFAEADSIFVFNDVRLIDDAGDAAQIDHLVMYPGGFVLIDSKSVSGTVHINTCGEFCRSWQGEWHGMQSPVQQIRLQAEFLRKRLMTYSSSKTANTKERIKTSFDKLPFDAVVAISDNGYIEREIETPNVMKADQVVDYVNRLMAAARVKPATGDHRDVISAVELTTLARFLVTSHVPLPQDFRAPHEPISVVHQMSALLTDTVQVIRDAMDNPMHGVYTGMSDIDDKLSALRPGGFYVLAARPGVGKTSLALRMVQGIVSNPENETPVLYVSLEVDRRDLMKKLISAVGKIDFKALDKGTLPEVEFERFEETTKLIRGWPLEVTDHSDITVNHLRNLVQRRILERKDPIRLIVVDYLQLLQCTSRDQDEYARISEITRVLKTMARELNLPVLALSQLSRDSEKGTTPREPRLSDLRGSGSIEQDADAVLFIHRTDSEDREGPDAYRSIKVIIAKNRFGPTGQTLMRFFPAKMSFEYLP